MSDVDEDVIVVKGYVTAFLDLLGLSERLLRFDKMSGGASEADRADILTTLKALRAFRMYFRTFYGAYSAPEGREPPQNLPPDKHAAWNATFPKDDPIIHQFADSIIVSVGIDPERPVAFFRAMDGLFLGCSISSAMMLIQGIPVRGAISTGFSARLDSGEVLGAAQVRAHRLEQEEAVVPRILIDPSLFAALHVPTKPLPNGNPDEFRLLTGMARGARSSLTRADDGYVFIDFLGDRVAKTFWIGKTEPEVRHFCHLIDQSIAANLISTKSQRRTHAKWCWLDSYWRSRRSAWLPEETK